MPSKHGRSGAALCWWRVRCVSGHSRLCRVLSAKPTNGYRASSDASWLVDDGQEANCPEPERAVPDGIDCLYRGVFCVLVWPAVAICERCNVARGQPFSVVHVTQQCPERRLPRQLG